MANTNAKAAPATATPAPKAGAAAPTLGATATNPLPVATGNTTLLPGAWYAWQPAPGATPVVFAFAYPGGPTGNQPVAATVKAGAHWVGCNRTGAALRSAYYGSAGGVAVVYNHAKGPMVWLYANGVSGSHRIAIVANGQRYGAGA